MIIAVTSADDPTPDNYVAALRRFDAEPRVIVSRHEDLRELLRGISGLLITGGTDIDPARYRAAAHPETDTPDRDRDEFELAAVRHATELGIPVLMICRGMQIANVAYGGTLHQHLPDLIDGTVNHRDLERKFDVFAEHEVTVEGGSLLERLTGSRHFATNASHHQAVDAVGEGLVVTARTSDGVVEALEFPAAEEFWLAVQWHPERLLDADGDEGRSGAIIAAFVDAARAYEARHSVA